ncbi:uncharacterized protein DUF3810 [Mucilaginibacter frigoritolerans]|uniref:Uncharacterized protein DUF3810 n=1 Tax=Mucilaginibacter frigoritolerans TaxID=652788 RepID=A0A562U7I0_9SPHI|nr:DUF3810 domain-containing protein [Mucilaginibacter frigoritolerans]TWJ01529.1 uncharacterized protein DUF3810 [Mucilaginibacter frigoritolerans]
MTGKLNKHKKSLKTRFIAIGTLAIGIFLLMLFADHPFAVEHYYSNGFYPVVCHILHPVLNLFPFSFGDLLYLVVTVYLIYAVFRLIKLLFKKDFKQAGILLLGFIAGVESAMLIFYLFWGMNYFRLPAGERLNLRDTSYSTADLKTVTTMLIDSANACRARITPADLEQDNSTIYKTAIEAVSKLSADSVNFRTYRPNIKPSLLTPLLNYIGTSGYYNPFTGEAQLNCQMPVFNRPVIACHEMSHQMGYGAEDEADFSGFLAGIGSHDRLLRYSAYHLAVDEFMHALFYRDSLENKALKPRVSTAVHHDFVIERAYWLSYQSKMDVVSSIFYDRFLKVNNQPQGLATYNRMVLLVMAKYRKSF